MKINEIKVKSILTESKLPGADYVVNPYSGCAFGCSYCYADFIRKFTGHMDDKWGDYVDVKINTPEIFKIEIESLLKSIRKESKNFKGGKYPIIFFSSVTDPYQGVEAKYKLTRQCLEILRDLDYEGEISILTKSNIVTRDIDVFKQLRNISVGLTITSTDDDVSRLMEKNAPLSSSRIKTLKELNGAGINTYAFVGPLLPNFVKDKDSLKNLFYEIEKTGNKEIWIEHLNLSGNKKQRLFDEIKDKVDKESLEKFWFSQKDKYKQELSEIVFEILKTTNLNIHWDRILDHRRDK